MALAPWNVLAGGKIRTDAEEKRREESGEGGRTMWADWKRTESERQVCLALEKVAEEVGAKSITSGRPTLWTPRLLANLTTISRDRLDHAKGPVRLPHCRRPQGRAFVAERRGPRHRAHP